MKNMFVGNLSYETSQEDLRVMFGEFGTVEKVAIITDKSSGRSRGFGFVEMSSDTEGQAAIDTLNGREVGGRVLIVETARPKVR